MRIFHKLEWTDHEAIWCRIEDLCLRVVEMRLEHQIVENLEYQVNLVYIL